MAGKDKDTKALQLFEVNDSDRAYQFWERNPLAIEIYSREVAEQKLRYIHNNPYQEKWNLVAKEAYYPFSSEHFYNTGVDEYNMLTHYLTYFEG